MLVESPKKPLEKEALNSSWYAEEVDQVYDILQTNDQGLSSDEVQHRLETLGPNKLPEVKPTSPIIRFLTQFHNVLIYVLLITAVTTAILGHWIDTAVIFGVVLINAIIGFIQEGKADDALRAIRDMLSPQAMAIRDGKRHTIDAADLVPGDVVLLQSGDRVPADMRLIQAKRLQIQESALTGESVPVEKVITPSGAETVLADRTCIAHSGTLVTSGRGAGVVIATGINTEIGKISALVTDVEQLTTPLLLRMAQFGRWLTAAIILIAALTFAFGILARDYTATQMLLAAVGLAVAAIPEGLPAIMTITLAIGVQRMAQRNAIVRRLPAVETLGEVNVICSDKTGTLTRNEMTVRTIATAEHIYDVSGTGYDPHGGFLVQDEEIRVRDHELLKEVIRAGLLCNDTQLEQKGEEWKVLGDPMEGALLIAGMKAGLAPEQETQQYPRTDLIPFDPVHKFMATLHHSHTGEVYIFQKGAPERVLEMCSSIRTKDGDQPLDIKTWQKTVEDMASKGQRVLAVAFKPGQSHEMDLTFKDVESGLTLLGLFGFIDPPREEAITAVEQCQNAGITVKMITGDHQITACAISRQLGLSNPDKALTGQQLEHMSDDELREMVTDVDVYARVSPEQKLRLVSLLQDNDLIVSMTGDGVNDAPALKRADIGVAMGNKGTEAAKEASDMVLADDNFASIARAILEGRTVYDNIRKSILFILPTNGGEAMIIIAAIVLGFQELPLSPLQILWVNMITAVTLALSIAFEPSEHNVMNRPPRDQHEAILSPMFMWRIAMVSFILLVGTFGLFIWEMGQGREIVEARTIAVNTLIFFEIFYLFNSRYITEPVLNREGLFGNKYVLIAIGILILFQMVFTYFGPLQALFGTADIGPQDWLHIVMVSSSVLFIVELEKLLLRRFRKE